MADLTRAQKMRLGVFLLVAGALTAGALVALVGSALLEKRDNYLVFFEGSVNGLEAGSSVKYNGIQVGRVDSLRVDDTDVTRIRVEVSLAGGTPIKSDTVAVLSLQGITGQMYIELTGGTNDAQLLLPGATIEARSSRLGMLLERADAIAGKIEGLVANLQTLTDEENAQQISATLREVNQISQNVRELTATITPKVESILTSVDSGTREIALLVQDGRSLLTQVGAAVDRVSQWVQPTQVTQMLAAVESTMRTAERRLGAKELGAALTAYTDLAEDGRKLLGTANLTLVRARDDLLRALDELVSGAESFSEFSAILRDDPSALLRGRSQAARSLP